MCPWQIKKKDSDKVCGKKKNAGGIKNVTFWAGNQLKLARKSGKNVEQQQSFKSRKIHRTGEEGKEKIKGATTIIWVSRDKNREQ